MAYIMQQQVNQPGLKLPATALGRLFDGAPKLFIIHRANKFLIVCQCFAQLDVIRAMGIEICTQCDEDNYWTIRFGRRREQVADKGGSFFLRAAEREYLLE